MNIIDTIRVSGTDYTLSATSSGGITSGEVQTMIDESVSGITERMAEDEEVTAAALNNLNDRISGISGNNAVEVTQAEYDALVSGGTVDPTVFYIITDAQAGDLTQYWTSAQTNSAINAAISGKADTSAVTESINAAVSGKVNTSTFNTYSGNVETALSGKQDTLSAGTNITIVDNVISAEGGGGKAISAGTNISVTTGETADTINCKIPYSDVIYTKSDIILGKDMPSVSDYNRVFYGKKIASRANDSFNSSIGIGVPPSNNSSDYNELYGSQSIGIGGFKIGNGSQYSNFVSGCVAIGYGAKTRINNAVAIGKDTEASGTTKTNINNQLTIDTSNQVYIYNKDNTEMICLQDQLGGSSITVDSALSSTSENPVQNKVIYNKFDEVEQVTAAALNELNDKIGDINTILESI